MKVPSIRIIQKSSVCTQAKHQACTWKKCDCICHFNKEGGRKRMSKPAGLPIKNQV